MKAGKYSIRELFNNRYVESIVVPEIQRDYVWKSSQVTGLLNSIYDEFNTFISTDVLENVQGVKDEIKVTFETYLKKQTLTSNIGFIYAYSDESKGGCYYLIDGQQRITTVFILLLILSSKDENFKSKFKKIYFFNGKSKLDFKVREASHDFLNNLCKQYFTGIDIENQSWYHVEYESDVTISSMIANIKTIESWFDDKLQFELSDFIDYIENYVEFWYFDTNVSEQGEELYIYMNARGEQMQENENLKADLLGKLDKDAVDLKNEWGIKWEVWQDFFFKHREQNTNADNGFNEFIKCISGLENLISKESIIYTKHDFESKEKGGIDSFSHLDILEVWKEDGLVKIENYVNALMYIFDHDNVSRFTKKYEYFDWIKKYKEEVFSILNYNRTNWFADASDDNQGLAHNRMIFLWSFLYYMSHREEPRNSNNEVFRFLRIFYLRYHNYDRSIKSLIIDVRSKLQYGIWKESDKDEERVKNIWFQLRVDPEILIKFEETLWRLEDHPLNLDGRDVGAINCTHLLKFESNPTLEELESITNKFYELFPKTSNGYRVVNENDLCDLLVFYGSYWDKVSPTYCLNMYFGNWKKTIRGRGSNDKLNPFLEFFNDYKFKSLEDLIKEKIVLVDIQDNTEDVDEIIKWFVYKLRGKLWQKGKYIATGHYKFLDNDKVFKSFKSFVNNKGSFHGDDHFVISKKLSI